MVRIVDNGTNNTFIYHVEKCHFIMTEIYPRSLIGISRRHHRSLVCLRDVFQRVRLCIVQLRPPPLFVHATNADTAADIAAESAILLSPRTVVCTMRRARISPCEQYNANVLTTAVPEGEGEEGDVRVRR
jgi:hypothetical protein